MPGCFFTITYKIIYFFSYSNDLLFKFREIFFAMQLNFPDCRSHFGPFDHLQQFNAHFIKSGREETHFSKRMKKYNFHKRPKRYSQRNLNPLLFPFHILDSYCIHNFKFLTVVQAQLLSKIPSKLIFFLRTIHRKLSFVFLKILKGLERKMLKFSVFPILNTRLINEGKLIVCFYKIHI